MSALAPYAGAWTVREAAHFLRRTGFGPTLPELERATKDGFAATLARAFDPQPETAEFRSSEAALRKAAHVDNDIKRLQAWWLYRMRHGANGLREKLALLWHNHFATGNGKVRSVEQMAEQHDLIRTHAAGSFRDLLMGMAKDGAMLAWLDGDNNRKRHANENFAREIMELFALGVGNYTEQDIQEAARAFTGWRLRDGRFWFDDTQHDTRPKTLFGKRGDYTGEHVVELCLTHPACPRFVALKLLKGFVTDQPAAAEIDAAAAELQKSDLTIGPALKTLLGSELFFAKQGAMIKGPLDFVVGAWRTFGVRPNLEAADELLRDVGQSVFEPPTVKGWEGGRRWLSAATLLRRSQFAAETAFGDKYGRVGNADDWKTATAAELADRLLARRPEPAALARLDGLLKSGDDGRRDALHLALTMPECQLM